MFALARHTFAALALFNAAHSYAAVTVPQPDWGFVASKLKRAGVSAEFVQAAKAAYEPDDLAKVLELNTLLFLRKADYHGPQVSDEAAADVRAFVEAHADDFHFIEEHEHVKPTVVASLIWMESRFGVNTGQFHVLSAFLDLVQADRAANISYLRLRAVPKFTDHLSGKDSRKIAKKARQRAKWALGEIKSLSKIWARDPELVKGLRGSFAGAFGMPQFEPTSYVRFARAKGDGAPNLSQPADAIRSVAYYLNRGGWRANKTASYRRALLKYNHSEDYARAILDLAARADGGLRAPSGRRSAKRRRKRRINPGRD